MRLVLCNGSPRGERGNSNLLLKFFKEGIDETPGHSAELVHLARVKEHSRLVEMCRAADAVVLAFPLYTDMMPGIVKAFIEALEPICGREGNPAVGFIIQSGFPEAVQLRALEAYLEKLSRRLGCRYLGTALRGGGEGLQVMPPFMIREFVDNIRALGREFGRTGEFDAEVISRLGKPEKLSHFGLLVSRTIGSWMANATFWHKMMKENGAYELRFARPYDEPPNGW